MGLKGFHIVRKISSNAKSTFFVTTPIYYVNASPHIGHLYSSLIADASVRWQRLQNPTTPLKLSTGTDEHGSKIQQAALKGASTPRDYCDSISQKYKNLAQLFGVDYTDFIRTTDSLHKESVYKFWNALNARGKIYSAKYSGWYCVSDETFLSDVQLKEKLDPDGRKTIISGESGHPVEWVEELNYMFPLRSLQDDVKYWISRNDFIQTRSFNFGFIDKSDGELWEFYLNDSTTDAPSTRSGN